MSVVDDERFNSVFISYSRRDEKFAQKFRDELQKTLNKSGNSIYVWIDKDTPKGREWRREIQRRLNSTALVVVILSPDSAKSPWVLYEWVCSLLVQQSEPVLVYFRKCEDDDLKRFTDYQLAEAFVKPGEQPDEVWKYKVDAINEQLDAIAKRLQGFSKLKEYYETLIGNLEEFEDDNAKTEARITAARNLGNVPEDLKLTAANYLTAALQFWLSHGIYGPVGISIANELGRLGKRKAMPTLVRFFLDQSDGEKTYKPSLDAVRSALSFLSYEEPA